jgi:hypothetical protein
VAKEIQDLIHKMSRANPGWGSPRIVGELELGIRVAKATVEKYMVRSRKPPSPTWRAFLENHVKELVSVDFFVGSHDHVQDPLRLRRALPCPAPDRAFQQHRAPDGPVDGPADLGGVSLGDGASLLGPRS